MTHTTTVDSSEVEVTIDIYLGAIGRGLSALGLGGLAGFLQANMFSEKLQGVTLIDTPGITNMPLTHASGERANMTKWYVLGPCRNSPRIEPHPTRGHTWDYLLNVVVEFVPCMGGFGHITARISGGNVTSPLERRRFLSLLPLLGRNRNLPSSLFWPRVASHVRTL